MRAAKHLFLLVDLSDFYVKDLYASGFPPLSVWTASWVARPVTPVWLGGKYVTELCEGGSLPVVGAVGHIGSCRGGRFGEQSRVSLPTALGKVADAGSASSGSGVWWGGLVSRTPWEGSGPCSLWRKTKTSFIATKAGGTEAPRWYTSLKTKSSWPTTLGYSHVASLLLLNFPCGVLLAFSQRRYCEETQIRIHL